MGGGLPGGSYFKEVISVLDRSILTNRNGDEVLERSLFHRSSPDAHRENMGCENRSIMQAPTRLHILNTGANQTMGLFI